MFKKLFLVALVLCVCYFGAISARPNLSSLPLVGSVGNVGNVAGGLPVDALGGAVGGAVGGALGGVSGQLTRDLPVVGQKGSGIL
ncbi:hypothetical protein ACLKA7_005754 [Drosophila subpalustris]